MPLLSPASKILSCEQAHTSLDAVRDEKTIVFTNGCFDIVHPGHVDLLTRCRQQGDILVVGVNTSASVRRIKGPARPVNRTAYRMQVLAGLASVSFVVAFEEDTPYALIDSLRPHVLIKGGDWTPENIVGRDIVEQYGGRVLSLPLLPGFSTTAVIEKILTLHRLLPE